VILQRADRLLLVCGRLAAEDAVGIGDKVPTLDFHAARRRARKSCQKAASGLIYRSWWRRWCRGRRGRRAGSVDLDLDRARDRHAVLSSSNAPLIRTVIRRGKGARELHAPRLIIERQNALPMEAAQTAIEISAAVAEEQTTDRGPHANGSRGRFAATFQIIGVLKIVESFFCNQK
jgi:hypothetical protein